MKNYDTKQITFFISIALFFSWTIVLFYLFFINPYEKSFNVTKSVQAPAPAPVQSVPVPAPVQSAPVPAPVQSLATPVQSIATPVIESQPALPTVASPPALPTVASPPASPVPTPIPIEEEIKVPTPEGLGNNITHTVSALNFSIEIPEDLNIEKRSFSPGDPSFFSSEQLFLYDRRWDVDFVLDVVIFPNDKLYKMEDLEEACANRQKKSPYERRGVFGTLEPETKIYWLNSGFEFKNAPLNNIGELIGHYPFASINYANIFLAKRQYGYIPSNISVQRDIKGLVENVAYYKTISHCFEYDGLVFTFMIGTPAWEGPNTLLRDAPDAFEIIGFEPKPSALTAGMSYEGISDFNPNDPYTMEYRIKQFLNIINSIKFIDPDLNKWTTEDAEYPDWNP